MPNTPGHISLTWKNIYCKAYTTNSLICFLFSWSMFLHRKCLDLIIKWSYLIFTFYQAWYHSWISIQNRQHVSMSKSQFVKHVVLGTGWNNWRWIFHKETSTCCFSLSDFCGFSSISEGSLGVDTALCWSYDIYTDEKLQTWKHAWQMK